MNDIKELVRKHLPDYCFRDVTNCNSQQLDFLRHALTEMSNCLILTRRTKDNDDFFKKFEKVIKARSLDDARVDLIFMYDDKLKAFAVDGDDDIEGIIRCVANSIIDNADTCVICFTNNNDMISCRLCGSKICYKCVFKLSHSSRCPVCKNYQIT